MPTPKRKTSTLAPQPKRHGKVTTTNSSSNPATPFARPIGMYQAFLAAMEQQHPALKQYVPSTASKTVSVKYKYPLRRGEPELTVSPDQQIDSAAYACPLVGDSDMSFADTDLEMIDWDQFLAPEFNIEDAVSVPPATASQPIGALTVDPSDGTRTACPQPQRKGWPPTSKQAGWNLASPCRMPTDPSRDWFWFDRDAHSYCSHPIHSAFDHPPPPHAYEPGEDTVRFADGSTKSLSCFFGRIVTPSKAHLPASQLSVGDYQSFAVYREMALAALQKTREPGVAAESYVASSERVPVCEVQHEVGRPYVESRGTWASWNESRQAPMTVCDTCMMGYCMPGKRE